jgi:hypothetical protein
VVIHSVRSDAPSNESASQENSPNDDISHLKPEEKEASVSSKFKAIRNASL